MEYKIRLLFIHIFFLIFILFPSSVKASVDGVTIGVNMFDPYFEPPAYQRADMLAPKKWHYLIPFYGQITGENSVIVRDDNQEAIDKQIQFASAAGIDYFAFTFWPSQDINRRMNHSLGYYLSSRYKNKLKFAVRAASFDLLMKDDVTKWDSVFIPKLIEFMKDSQYQTVLEGRPLVYLAIGPDLFGGEEAFRHAITRLRTKAQQNDLKNPYIVAQVDNLDDMRNLRMDSVFTYTNPKPGSPGSFSRLMDMDYNFWNSSVRTLIPTLDIGWDNRPQQEFYGKQGRAFMLPTGQELFAHLTNAIAWVKNHPGRVPTQNLYVYSWSEMPESGYISIRRYRIDRFAKTVYKQIVISNIYRSVAINIPSLKSRGYEKISF